MLSHFALLRAKLGETRGTSCALSHFALLRAKQDNPFNVVYKLLL